MTDQVIGEVADGVQTIRFERMEAENRLTSQMCESTADALSFGESSSRVRAILFDRHAGHVHAPATTSTIWSPSPRPGPWAKARCACSRPWPPSTSR